MDFIVLFFFLYWLGTLPTNQQTFTELINWHLHTWIIRTLGMEQKEMCQKQWKGADIVQWWQQGTRAICVSLHPQCLLHIYFLTLQRKRIRELFHYVRTNVVLKDPAYYFIGPRSRDSFHSPLNMVWIHNKYETIIVARVWKHSYLNDGILSNLPGWQSEFI